MSGGRTLESEETRINSTALRLRTSYSDPDRKTHVGGQTTKKLVREHDVRTNPNPNAKRTSAALLVILEPNVSGSFLHDQITLVALHGET